MNTNYHHIDYNYAYFTFSYTWLRDKQIIHRGNTMGGTLIILDADGNMVKMFGYERIA
jgi:hypothetical protein